MADNLGQVDASSTINIWFTTHAQTGAAVAPSTAFEAADVRLYKNGSATQRTSEVGWTMTSPFDTVTGLHLLTIDLSDNTDAGFYAAGSRYAAVLSPDETVDGLAVVSVLAIFSIGPISANVTQWLSTAAATPTVAGVPEVDVTHWLGTAAATPTVNGVPEVDITHWKGTAAATVDTAGYPVVTVKDGTGAGEIDTTSGAVAISAGSLFATALTESYATDGSTATVAQLLYMIWSAISEPSLSGLTLTGRKLDGSTTAMTWSIDSATNPTVRTRTA